MSSQTRSETRREVSTGTGAIVAENLVKSFDKGIVKALDGLTLRVSAGEYVSITGPSGCGKSTLMHMLAALDRPDSGRLMVDGADLMRLHDPDGFRRSRVGLVFQMHNLLAHLDAKANVSIAMLGTSRTRRQISERADELLEMVGLAAFSHRRPPEMSGGERQRVAIARALANEPSILLADEPTGSLDSHSVDRVLNVLDDLRRERPVTIVMVTHDDGVAMTADRMIHLVDGRVSEPTA
ncbi:MAG: ABC transporter ATP-binding protein [Acidimicrobiales bacterium]|nr:ABC transporter ATP-binding protein [Acidimicrobiales bacterium]